jgi:hypothetical protein
MQKNAHVFTQRNGDGTFTIGVEDSSKSEAIRVDAFGALDIIWNLKKLLKESPPPPPETAPVPEWAVTERDRWTGRQAEAGSPSQLCRPAERQRRPLATRPCTPLSRLRSPMPN